MKDHYAVAIDGPSGAGKSTLAKRLAASLKIVYVDTGAIYRSIGYYVYQNGIDPKDTAAVTAVLPRLRIEAVYGDDGLQHMILNGADVTKEIRLPEVSMYTSAVSAIPEVRAYLLQMQRDMAARGSVVMDGRDIGTVVLPQAEVKIYLDASPEVRAGRREKELAERGTPKPFEEVLREVKERDWADMHRDTAPLRQAEDAVRVDTSDLDFEGSLALLRQVIREQLEKK